MSQGFLDSPASELSTHRRLRSDGKMFDEAVEFIRHSAIEQLYFFKNGKQIARFKGATDYVNPAELSLLLMKDAIVLHNHPGGTSFSISDVKAIVRYNAARLVVVAPEFTYTVIRPKNGWEFAPDSRETNDLIEEAVSTAQDTLRKMEARGEIFSSDKLYAENHYIWIYSSLISELPMKRSSMKEAKATFDDREFAHLKDIEQQSMTPERAETLEKGLEEARKRMAQWAKEREKNNQAA